MSRTLAVCRALMPWLAWLGLCLSCPLSASADEQPSPPRPLHQRIDEAIASVSLGQIAPLADDADFLRRAYLDLNGTIPDAATARAFLSDTAANKRQALIDRLLERDDFARHMARTFDVMWMERRAQKVVPITDWQEYLRASFAANKPLDQLSREVLLADGVEPSMRPAARFFLDRDADPNLLARDVGRLFFGRDFQCAQCHDHPNIEDYWQADYYGLMAFVNRSALFTDKDNKIFYAETADGEVNYKSVFTGEARDHVVPRLPGGAVVQEPTLAKNDQYVIAPAKGTRGVPKYSRRAQLAALATRGDNPAFNRNLANRLWSLLMGRGLVHPLDVEHPANPAISQQLLTLLADELVRMKFDAKAFLRELALTQSYQRSSQMPRAEEMRLDLTVASATLAAWRGEQEQLAARLPALKEASNAAGATLRTVYEKYSASATARDAAEKAWGEVKKASDEISQKLAASLKEIATKQDQLKALSEARDKAQAAVAKLPGDKALADAAQQFQTRAAEFDAQLTAVRATSVQQTAQVQAESLRLAEADKALHAATAATTMARVELDDADAKAGVAREQFRAAQALHHELTARLLDGEKLVAAQTQAAAAVASRQVAENAHAQLAADPAQSALTAEQQTQAAEAAKAATERAAVDRASSDQAWSSMVERAEVRFSLAQLRPLSPEQLAVATMQALGVIDQQRTALLPEVKTAVEARAELTPEQKAAEIERQLAAKVDEKLRGNIAPFVSLFGQQPGQAPTFQATAQQALFLSNGGLLSAWLNPGGNNLTERIAKLEPPAAVAEELYLSVLSRLPSADEQQQVAQLWEAGKADRPGTARELVWSLITSVEFRFNH